MSERDSQRKVGGTKDTVGLWPNSQRHITINPDVYVSMASVPEETTKSSASSSQQNRTDRPVLYFCCLDLSPDDPNGETVLAYLEGASLPAAVIWRKDNELVVGFKQLLGAIEFATHALSSATDIHPASRVTLHAGPFPLSRAAGMHSYPNEGGIEAPITAIEQLIGVHHFTPIGSVYASGPLAALLALDTSRYKLSFVDTLREADKRPIHPIDVFSVTLLHLSKLTNH
jgi:hypothetical protein